MNEMLKKQTRLRNKEVKISGVTNNLKNISKFKLSNLFYKHLNPRRNKNNEI